MIIGEAPGYTEDKEGKPFCGKSGRLLQQIILDNDLTIKDLYVTNVVKNRPPNNRNPTSIEIQACSKYSILRS